MSRLGPLLALLAISLGAATASADAIGPPPVECPPGSRGHSSHCGEWCAPSTCKEVADCPKDGTYSCQSRGVCVEEDDSPCSDRAGNARESRRVARNPCESDADCIRPARCETAMRCVREAKAAPPPAPAPSSSAEPESRSCSCSLPGAGSSHAEALAALAALGALALSRRRVTS